MDLYAYAQIEDLEKLLEMNGIKDIKRLRGLRLMATEKVVSETDIKKEIRSNLKYALEAFFAYEPEIGCWCYDDMAELKAKWYLYKDGTPNWKRIHGKLRKAIKFEMKKEAKKVRAEFEMFNKYVGREDVLYIHTRTGGNNWNYYECYKYLSEPWYLDHVNDCFDSTYCDIYAKIDPETVKKLAEMEKEESKEEKE